LGTLIVRRLLVLVPLLLFVTFAVSLLVYLLPGDDAARAIAGGPKAPEARVAEVRHQLHLDDGMFERYGHWLGDAVQGDLGTSLFNGLPVADDIGSRFPITFSLALGAAAVSLLIGVPLGIATAVRRGSLLDRFGTVVSSFGIAMPDFWLAILLVIVFAVSLGVLPAIGYTRFGDDPLEWARHLVLPWIALGLGGSAILARQLRGSLVDVLDQDYVRTARAHGVPERRIVNRYALKNAAAPALTIFGIQFAYLLGGTVIIEQIFSIPGMGLYVLTAISRRDLPVIQGVVVVVALTFVLSNLVVDVAYGYLNPKVRDLTAGGSQ
jgi:peptide/nickel transport system permease protein